MNLAALSPPTANRQPKVRQSSLDGGRVLRAVLWSRRGDVRSATKTASSIGSGFGLVLIILGVLRVVAGDFIGGMWSFLIGSFLRNAAGSAYQQTLLRESLRGATVRQFT